MKDILFPTKPDEFTPELLSQVLSRQFPGCGVAAIGIVDSKVYGDATASTAGRVVLKLKYKPGSSDALPPRVVIKIARDQSTAAHHALYANEVDFYMRIRPELDIETPRCFGGSFDDETGTFGLVLEDMGLRDAQFMNVLVPHSPEQVRAVLDVFASLHGRYWRSPRFESDLDWVQPHVSGKIHNVFTDSDQVPGFIKMLTETISFKREMVQRLGFTVDELGIQKNRVQRHQATLPQTLLHGDGHVGNTYRVGNRGGLIDWQLMARGYCMHDVGYYLMTSMQIEDRRRHEHDLLKYYLGKLREAGVSDAPDFDAAWLEYRRCAAWNVYIGWLTADIPNYGWEICVLAHLRVMTAYEDLESAKAIAALP